MVASAHEYGEQVASFLVDMQLSSLPYIKQLELLFHNPKIRASVSNLATGSAELMHNTGNLPDADEISSIFLRNFQYDASRASTDGKVFSHGDYTTINFLVDEGKPTLGIADWEMAGVRSPAHDLALLLARARVFLGYNPTNKSILSFTNGFMDTYRQSVKKRDVNWYKNEREKYLFACYLGIFFGASVLYWSRLEPCCPLHDGICDHKPSLVAIAADYIRRCRLGPEKITYDSMSNDQFFGRLFQASNANWPLKSRH